MEHHWKGFALKKAALWLTALVIIAAIVFKLLPGDEKVIKKRLTALAETVSVRGQDSTFKRLAAANGVVDFFTPDASIQIEGVDIAINDRNDLREAVLAARGRLAQLRIEFVDVHVRFPEEKLSAFVYATAVAHLDGQTNTLARALKLGLRKIERQWLISTVESISGAQ